MAGLGGEVAPGEVGFHCGVGARVEFDLVASERGELLDREIGGIDRCHPEILGEEFGEDDGGALGFNDRDGAGAHTGARPPSYIAGLRLRNVTVAPGPIVSPSQLMEAEEAVTGVEPLEESGFSGFEELGDPGLVQMTIPYSASVVDHPEDTLAALALAEVKSGGGMGHLGLVEQALGDNLLAEVGVVGTAEFNEVLPVFRETEPFGEGSESVGEEFFPCHRVAQVIFIILNLKFNLILPLYGGK